MIYFMSILGGEYIKIGYTGQEIDKRKCALQTGNPYEIEVLFAVDGSLRQEQAVHKGLKEAFERVKVFNNPVNEWYPGENSMIKMFIKSVKKFGIDHSIKVLNNLHAWKKRVKETEVFTIRHLEKALRERGLSRKQAKMVISQNKADLMASICNGNRKGIADEMVRHQSQG
jgi:hypothetical protein